MSASPRMTTTPHPPPDLPASPGAPLESEAEFVARGEAAIARWRIEGGGISVDEAIAQLQAQLDAAAARCRPAVATRPKGRSAHPG